MKVWLLKTPSYIHDASNQAHISWQETEGFSWEETEWPKDKKI